MAGHGDRVTWRLELPGAWGGRLDPAWLPTSGTEGWRRVFEGEDLAARLFSAGGAGLRWAQLAGAAAALAGTLAEYRLQWRVAEQVAAGCDGPGGLWRHALLVDGGAVEVSVHAGLPAAAASVAVQRGG